MLLKVLGLLALLYAGGCQSDPWGPYSDRVPEARNPELARELHAQATRIKEKDLDQAELLLREALNADLYHGPAHNNLGVIYLSRGQLYDAASEFEWARKLMPGHPEPRVNLALALERAGQTDEAISAYRSALAVWDNHLPAQLGLARLQVSSGNADEETFELLDTIAMRGDPQWREWAKLWKIKLEQSPASSVD